MTIITSPTKVCVIFLRSIFLPHCGRSTNLSLRNFSGGGGLPLARQACCELGHEARVRFRVRLAGLALADGYWLGTMRTCGRAHRQANPLAVPCYAWDCHFWGQEIAPFVAWRTEIFPTIPGHIPSNFLATVGRHTPHDRQ